MNETTIGLNSVISRNDTVLASDLGGEIVMMDVNSGNYHILEGVGGSVWTLIETPRPVFEIVAALQKEYDVDAQTCESETLSFVQDMLASDVICVA